MCRPHVPSKEYLLTDNIAARSKDSGVFVLWVESPLCCPRASRNSPTVKNMMLTSLHGLFFKRSQFQGDIPSPKLTQKQATC